ncbi:hypothetical protein T440DRAFT_68060 [Plenodomus tracheiphilus IPT5]|uniref:Zn(2)-C6 fungal-type domain-containing protein n=1 Tax=Plenodomus tracheiphilus IPT5 TaxID=1408161 RepID=A0A6A7B6Z4_9PLEO|nr:hypothetical protein T440DRAFT_68060 [Plenodomus tracheiphilus IPT5]
MGKYRSKSGCLTCRARRVKCDETHPKCKACEKKNRPCEWEAPHTRFKDYQPESSASKPPGVGAHRDNAMHSNMMDVDGVGRSEGSNSRANSPSRNNGRTGPSTERASASVSSPSAADLSPGSSLGIPDPRGSARGVSVASLLHTQTPEDLPEGTRAYSSTPKALTHHEALLVHHYTEYLGRWLDCTDCTRQFTLGVPEKVKLCPVLCYAVLSFAARHRQDTATADAAYQKCLALLIERLDEDAASHDETLLCAIVILRFYEQLNGESRHLYPCCECTLTTTVVPSSTGSDDEQHLSGCSAIIRTSQGHHFVDPSAPTLREAAFWVYVRQCLYNATINQTTLDIDFSLQLHPTPSSMRDSHPLARLRLETAWCNQMVWNTACVVNFCYESADPQTERIHRPQRWQELWDLIQAWNNERPEAFNAIFDGTSGDESAFRVILFTADWHVMAFAFYHLSCLMLLSYKPGPKFAIRNIGRLSETDHQILSHARAICGASKSSRERVPVSIILCHTIFIWGPLITDPGERDEILQLLVDFERSHIWPTAWIVSAIKFQWGVE